MAAPFSVTKHWINLSSADRTSGNSNDFNIQFNSGGITNDSGGFFGSKSYINPIFFSFPNNAPNIQDNFNNVFYISGSKFAGPDPYAMLTLPQGVYQNVKQLGTGIAKAVNDYISVIHATVLPTAYTGTITVAANTVDSDLTYNKFVFTFVSPGSTETLNFYFSIGTPVNYAATNPLNFGSVIGTDENIFTLTATTTTHTLPYLPNLQIYDIIQIKCNLTRSTYELEYKSGVTTNGILSPSLIMVAFPTANFTVNDSILFSNNN